MRCSPSDDGDSRAGAGRISGVACAGRHPGTGRENKDTDAVTGRAAGAGTGKQGNFPGRGTAAGRSDSETEDRNQGPQGDLGGSGAETR